MAKVNLSEVGKNLLKSADSGEKVELQSLWQDQPLVVFFLRRFGCQVCRWMAAEISKLEPDLRANGVSLVGVGPEELGLQEFKEGGFFKGCKHNLPHANMTLNMMPSGCEIRSGHIQAEARD
ncbi:hypothetical protein AMECASPLE_003438 [Ameca splendens]|uniref:Alkyl hydroperoxide reductase subunit C/ Thiol specific antioxidant domain-containing protein n=2 Tax=Goodeidae TaxID=28758 RepID=A0ABU7B307_9TELE|nr:hypothetical protein [Ataeniobius toweri]